MDPAKVEGFQEPLVLGVSVPVLVCAEGVGDPFDRVDNWTDKVVGWVHLVPRPSVWVWNQIAAVDDRVTEGLVLVLHQHLGAETAFQALDCLPD